MYRHKPAGAVQPDGKETANAVQALQSRKNPVVAHLRKLGADRAYRQTSGEYLCDGEKLLREAVQWGAEITAVLWADTPRLQLDCPAQYVAEQALLDYVSPLKNAASVVFSVRMSAWPEEEPGRTLVLETIQDPGNLGTILRTANALGIDTVILTGQCADVYNPKTIRAGMGAVFRQRCLTMDRAALKDYLDANGLALYGAALSPRSSDIRDLDLRRCAVAIGSEGQGLSDALLSMCRGELIIPMREQCESLNAAIAAAIVMWELSKTERS